jgi:AcrR family transcriptional regulator
MERLEYLLVPQYLASVTSNQPPSSLRERKKQRMRDDLYAAALELFAERPYAEVTVDDICARAEVARATFFRFFGSKAGLLMAFNEQLAERASTALDAADAATASSRIRIVVAEVAAAWRNAPPPMRDVFAEFIRIASAADAGHDVQPALLALLAEIVRTGQQSGELTDDLNADLIALLIVATLGACVLKWFEQPDPKTLDRTIELTTTVLLTGLTHRSS